MFRVTLHPAVLYYRGGKICLVWMLRWSIVWMFAFETFGVNETSIVWMFAFETEIFWMSGFLGVNATCLHSRLRSFVRQSFLAWMLRRPFGCLSETYKISLFASTEIRSPTQKQTKSMTYNLSPRDIQKIAVYIDRYTWKYKRSTVKTVNNNEIQRVTIVNTNCWLDNK